MVGIYKITNMVNGKCYVGQSIDIWRRWSEHRQLLNRNKHYNKYLQRAWAKYGMDNFSFQTISICELKQLDDMELHYINIFNPEYNNMGGGYSLHSHTEETKKKISQAGMGNTWNIGRKWDKEVVDKRKISRMGYKHSEETKAKMSKSAIGKKGTNLGKKFSEEHKLKIALKRNKKIMCINDNLTFISLTECSKHYNTNPGNISSVCSGKRKTVFGKTFKYIEGE